MDAPANDSTLTRVCLDRLRDGDARAMGELLEHNREYLHRVVELRLDIQMRGRVDASDVVQEAQIEATRRMDEYLQQPALPFRLWLRRIAYDRLIMMRRRHVKATRRSVTRELPLPEHSSVHLARRMLGETNSPSRNAIEGELASRVCRALTRLDEQDREIILMRSYEGLTNLEAAQAAGIEPAAASKRFGRALLKLRRFLLAPEDQETADG